MIADTQGDMPVLLRGRCVSCAIPAGTDTENRVSTEEHDSEHCPKMSRKPISRLVVLA